MRPLQRRLPIKGRGYSLLYQGFGPLMCNTYAFICDATKKSVIIDPACQNPHEFDQLQKGLDGSEVSHILLTHGHCDHVVGVNECLREWPNASLHLHPLELENYKGAPEMGRQFGLHFTPSQIPLPQPTDMFADGEEIRIGESIQLKVVHTPGHAPGHVAFCDHRKGPDNDGSVIVGGDLLFRGSVGRTDFQNSSLEDLYASLYRIYDMFDDDSIVLSGHTTATFLKSERETNPFVAAALQNPTEWWEELKRRHEWI